MKSAVKYFVLMVLVIFIISTGYAARFQIDFQGDANHGAVYGQTDPVNANNPGAWNIFEVAALDAPYPGPATYTAGPISLVLTDDQGQNTSAVFTLANDAWGWSGDAGQESKPLQGDYLLLLNSFGVNSEPADWQLSGLQAYTEYKLTFYHGSTGIAGRSIDFTANGTAVSVTGVDDTASVIVTSDADGDITGMAANSGSEGNWAGLVIEKIPTGFQIDFQGDANHGGVYGQTDPVDATSPDIWNIFEVGALDAGYPGPVTYTPGPISQALLDIQGDTSSAVFTITNDSWGWAGDAGQESEPLQGDYLLILDSFGVNCDPTNWELTGLQPNVDYKLTFYHGNTGDAARSIDFTANGVAASVTGVIDTASVVVTADGDGKVTGTAANTGTEGNWAGLKIQRQVSSVKNPEPWDTQPEVMPLTTLSWTPIAGASSQQIYFGTVSGSLSLMETLTGTAFSVTPVSSPLRLETTYYWRVDTVIDSDTIVGEEWEFTTRAAGSCDLDVNGSIGVGDVIALAEQWLEIDCSSKGWCSGADLNFSDKVDLGDFSILSANWGAELPQDIIFDFETGDMQGWRIVEGAFGMFICDRDTFHNNGQPNNKQGEYYATTLETPDYGINDGYTGIAESPVFMLTAPEISFLVGGGDSSSANYVAICTVDENLNEQEIQRAYGIDSNVMQRINWNLPDLVGQTVFIRMRDNATGGWGHVELDDFAAKGIMNPALTTRRWANLPLPINLDAARAVVVDLMETYPAEDYPNGQTYLDQLDSYEQQIVDLRAAIEAGTATQGDLDALVAVVEDYVRQVLIANPLVSDQPILFITRDQYPYDHHNTHTFFPNYDGELNIGSFRTGGAMKTIDFADGGTIETLIETPNGVVRDPDVYFDGSKIVFAMRNEWADNYSIYEMNADGSSLTQLTTAIRVSDLDPIYLPDDSIAFSSTREPKYVHCNRQVMCNLYRMDADGANVHQISKNPLFDFQLSLTDDGRIMYSRWEYVDRNFGDGQGAWTCLPDGRNHAHYFGNNTASPGAIIDPRQIPGTSLMVCIFSGAHERPWGPLAIVDRRLGDNLPQPNKPNPVRNIWPEEAIDMCGGWDGTTPVPLTYTETGRSYSFDNVKHVNPKYEDPYPLYDPNYPDSTGKYFLVSRMTGSGEKTGIYLVDTFGNEILLHEEAGSKGCYDPMPLRSRPRPPQIPNIRKYDGRNGKFYLMNAYEGTHMEGVEPDSIKYLRVLEATRKNSWTHPAWRGQGQVPPGMAWHDFYSKKILGTVPIEADGSAYFEVPAEVPVYFQILDANGKMIQSMRSFTMVQPGEMIGCVGCHESRTDAAPIAADNSYLPTAIQRDPDQLTGFYGQIKPYNFLDDVQPVFTANCVSCHGYDTPGGAKAGLLLEPDKTVFFNTAYNELRRKGYVDVVDAGYAPIRQAFSWGSHASLLAMVLDDDNHAGLNLTAEERDRIMTWIDINAPYYPVYTSYYRDNQAGRSPLTNSQLSDLSYWAGVAFNYAWNSNTGPHVSFDRPEKSPCLTGLSGSAYDNALMIIQAGADNLTANPRADMPGHVPSSVDQTRIDKHTQMMDIEALNRLSIHEGRKEYDSDHDYGY